MSTATHTNSATTEKQASNQQHRSDAPFTDSARQQAHQIIDKVADRGSAAEKNVRSAVEKSGDKVAEKQQQAMKTMESSFAAAKRLVQDHPYATGAAVFAAGFLFSAWLRRR